MNFEAITKATAARLESDPGSEDDLLGLSLSDLTGNAYSPGDRVRVLDGNEAGELGTVKKDTVTTANPYYGCKFYWVHLDYDEDPWSAIAYREDRLQFVSSPLKEDEDEDDLLGMRMSDFEPPLPPPLLVPGVRVRITNKHSHNYNRTGTVVGPDATPYKNGPHYWIEFDDLPHWMTTYAQSDLQPLTTENLKATCLVRHLSEMEDEDFIDVKEFNPNQLDLITQDLKKAGFIIERAREVEGAIQIVFSWPFTGVQMYLDGWKRAKEVFARYFTLHSGNYQLEKKLSDTDRRSGVVRVSVTKPIEIDPDTWKISGQPIPNGRAGSVPSPHFFQIFFHGQIVGKAYLPAGVGPGYTLDTAERLREEMAQLHQIVPFIPDQWPNQDAGRINPEWDNGPAIVWWRRNRAKLPNAYSRSVHFTKSLLGE